MTKVGYFRKRVKQKYESNELAEAAAAGESLLAEHAGNQTNNGAAYADDLFNLARVYDELGPTERAIELYVESARLTYAQEGESLFFAWRLNNLAVALSKIGGSASAYRLFGHVASILRDSLSATDLALADGLYNWGNAAADLLKTDEALQLHNEALAIREQGAAAEDMVCSLHSIAFLHEEKNERTQALHCAETALAYARGTEAYMSACFYLAGLYDAASDYMKAEPLYMTVLAQIAEEMGRNHSAYVTVAARLANTQAGLEKYAQSLATQCEIHDLLKDKVGGNHLFFANCLRSMAILHKQLDQPDEAAPLMLRSMKIRKRVMGEHARDLITDAVFLIDLYINGNQLDKALDMLVFTLIESGGGNPDFEGVLSNLTEIYTRGGLESFKTILREMEKLNDRERLWDIVRYWSAWEHQED